MSDCDPKIQIMLEQGQNTGIIEPSLEELLKVSGLNINQFPVLAPDGNWDSFLTDFQDLIFEPQYGVNFDTLGCNIFSGTHVLEAEINAYGGDPYFALSNGKTRLSSRFGCVEAGLDGLMGSSERQWEDMINNSGVVREDTWPFPFSQVTPIFNRENFFLVVENQVVVQAKQFYTRWQPYSRNVGLSDNALRDALKYGPVKIFIATGAEWNQGEPNVIPRTDNPMNHAVLLRRVADDGKKYILDQYPPFLKVLAPDYTIFYAFQTLLTKKGTQRMLVFFRVKGTTTIYSLMDGEWVGFSDLSAFNKYIDGRPAQVIDLDPIEFAKIKASPDIFKL